MLAEMVFRGGFPQSEIASTSLVPQAYCAQARYAIRNFVEVPGIEPGSFRAQTGLLRV